MCKTDCECLLDLQRLLTVCWSQSRDLVRGSNYDAEYVTVAWHECSPRSSERSETGAVRLSKASRELLAARHIHV